MPTKPKSGTEPPAVVDLAAHVAAEIEELEHELAEIDLLIGQARTEAGRHEQKRSNAADKVPQAGTKADAKAIADAYSQLVTLTRRSVLMEAQVDVLEGKRKALSRHVDGLRLLTGALAAAGMEVPATALARLDGAEGGDDPTEGARSDDADDGTADGGGAMATAAGADRSPVGAMPPSVSRMVLAAQEDMRREIARALHDGPAQSLTNIVLQAQIVDRMLQRDPGRASGELRQLVGMVQQTLDATKNFIFDVRPMVLDDLGLVPTLRRATRDRGRRAHVPVEFDTIGQDQRLPVEVESGLFRILDEALGAYLAQGPERIALRLEWGDTLEATLEASRTFVLPEDDSEVPATPAGSEVPAALAAMIEDRRASREAAVEAARQAAIVTLAPAIRRDIADRAVGIGAQLDIAEDGGRLRLVLELPGAPDHAPA